MDTETTLATAAIPARRGLRGRVPLLQPLEGRDFRLLWAGESVSLLGNQFHFVALATLVFAMTGSGLALGTVLIAASIPRAAFMVLGGALTDRLSPRSLMLGSNALRALTVGVLAGLVLADRAELWHLVALAVIFGSVDAVFYPALNTIVAMLVPPDRLPAANGLVQGTTQLTHLIGPALAGILVAAVGTGTAFVVDAASFGIAALALFAIAGGRRSPAADAPTLATERLGTAVAPGAGLAASIVEGARYAFRDPGIRAVILLSAAFNLATHGSVAVALPWLANVRFEGGATLLGFMFAAFGGGAVVGALVAGSTARPRHAGLLILGLSAVLGTSLGSIGLAPGPLVAMALMVLCGLTAGYINVTIIAWLQARVAPALLGRVMSLVMLGVVSLQPLSLAVAGLLVDAHATGLFLLAGGTILAAVAAAVLSGAHRSLD